MKIFITILYLTDVFNHWYSHVSNFDITAHWFGMFFSIADFSISIQ